MSDAFCISASSCADLIIRQPRTTGAPGRISTPGQRAPQTVDGEEAHRLLDPDRAGEAAVAQEAGDGAQRVLVLVPDAHVGRHLEALADRGLLEMRGDDADRRPRAG